MVPNGLVCSPALSGTCAERGTAGRRETPGRPLQYATTPEFLAHFNLASRRDLPAMADLKAAGLLDREPPKELPLPLGGREE